MNNDSTGRRPQTITNAVGTDANDGTFGGHVGKVLVVALHRRRQVRRRASLVIKHQSRLVSNAARDLGARVHKVITERLWHDWVVVVQRVLHDEVANPPCRCLQLAYRPVTRLHSYLAELTAVSRTVACPAGSAYLSYVPVTMLFSLSLAWNFLFTQRIWQRDKLDKNHNVELSLTDFAFYHWQLNTGVVVVKSQR